MRNSYVHEATEPDFDKPVIMCSFCNEQKLIVMPNPDTSRIFFLCNACDYEWEWNTQTMKWDGYSLENGKWEEEWAARK